MMRSLFDAPVISVGELCRRIRHSLEAAFPGRVRVSGEIFKCTVSTSGHVYFSLKDRDGLIRCACYRGTAVNLPLRFPLPDGVAVEVLGRVTTYQSQYQLVLDDIVPVGRGELFRLYELLKEKLRREGLFDESRKRPVPAFVRRVAIVTSRGAAALQDFLTTCRRRGAHVNISVVHTIVQGEGAPEKIAAAIRYAGRLPVDVVVVARGGGSLEDLFAFNTEAVARAIVSCGRPVISAIGHETDVTIADFAADRRAATPTAAAEMVSPNRERLLLQIASCRMRMGRALLRQLGVARSRLDRVTDDVADAARSTTESRAQRIDGCEARLRALDPRRRAGEFRRRITIATQRLKIASARSFIDAFERIRELAERHRIAFARLVLARNTALDVADVRLRALAPTATLRRGYAIVFDAQRRVLVDSARTGIGEKLDIELHRGRVGAKVTSTEEPHGES